MRLFWQNAETCEKCVSELDRRLISALVNRTALSRVAYLTFSNRKKTAVTKTTSSFIRLTPFLLQILYPAKNGENSRAKVKKKPLFESKTGINLVFEK